MPNNPVQIILNDGDFLRAPEPGRGGTEKDFFSGNDRGFASHKQELLGRIEEIAQTINDWSYGPAAYLRVRMRPAALAKSYRPNSVLFTKDNFPCVGADGVGTLYFRTPQIYLGRLRRRIEDAEVTVITKVNGKTGEPYKAPSRARSEVGAIDSVEIAPPSEKRDFSTSEALEMLQDPATVSGYLVELFETPSEAVIADDPLGRVALLSSLEETLRGFGAGLRTFLVPPVGRTPVMEFQLTRSDHPAFIDNLRGMAFGELVPRLDRTELDMSTERHETVLRKLAAHPLVRTIRPPVRLGLADTETPMAIGETVQLPQPAAGATYPIVGVIDSGVSDVLSDWLVGRFDFLNEDECNPEHGTKVGGLIAVGKSVNDPAVVPEPSGCLIYDVALFPKGAFLNTYTKGFTGFIEEVEQAVIEAKEEHGVRIFNLSINARSEVESHRYSIYAGRLDEIADRHGVIFVNSAGNLLPEESRAPWQKKSSDVVRYFAGRTQPDTIMKPAESVRGLSVGALNPPNTPHLEGAPTVYTRRGSGLQVGVKPDLAMYGGAGVGPDQNSGLSSIDANGSSVQLAGTSYAAPLVARTLAGLDAMTEGGLDTEALRAMMLHNTQMPHPLTRRGMKELARQFAGYGKPVSASEMLETDDHQITLIFQSRLTIGERRPAILRFPFNWPSSLVDPATGACSGHTSMTLVYSPPLDPAFGAEFVRINLEASLRQRQPKLRADQTPSFINKIAPRYLPNASGLGVPEKALITHGLKWWPSKQYESNFKNLGESSEWRLEVSSLVRAEAVFPAEGVPFAVILTIEDANSIQPIFQEMRQALQSSVANAVDIRTATRIRPRRQ